MSSVQQGLHLAVWDGESELGAGAFHRPAITALFSAPLQSLSLQSLSGILGDKLAVSSQDLLPTSSHST